MEGKDVSVIVTLSGDEDHSPHSSCCYPQNPKNGYPPSLSLNTASHNTLEHDVVSSCADRIILLLL